MRNIILDIVKELDNSVFSRKEEIDMDNFSKINAKDYGKSVAFVDGGNAELLKAPNFSLQFIRTCSIVFKNNKKKNFIKNEFFTLSYAIEEKGISYKTKIFSLNGDCIEEKDLKFNIFDETIKQGKEKASVSVVGNIARRFSELRLAAKTDADIIVIDGNLKSVYKNEEKYFDELLKKDCRICGLAKTSDIITKKGNCPVSILGSMNIDYAWYYPTYKRVFVKLNKASDYVFSLQTNNREDIDVIVNQIAANANDAVFPGYPYGLVLADKLARISDEEKQRLRLLFKTMTGWKKIKKYINATNAHDILDNIN